MKLDINNYSVNLQSFEIFDLDMLTEMEYFNCLILYAR
jgi:hypothetical protein